MGAKLDGEFTTGILRPLKQKGVSVYDVYEW